MTSERAVIAKLEQILVHSKNNANPVLIQMYGVARQATEKSEKRADSLMLRFGDVTPQGLKRHASKPYSRSANQGENRRSYIWPELWPDTENLGQIWTHLP